MQCFEDECCYGCYFDCSCCLKTWKEFNVLGWWCKCSCDKRKNSEDFKDDHELLSNSSSNGNPISSNPMQRSVNTSQWKETQTEGDMLLGDEKAKYDGTDITRLREELEADRRRMAVERADFAREREELDDERRRIAGERHQAMLDMEEAERQKKAAEHAIEDAELKQKETKAGFMLQHAMSRHSLSEAQHKREEAELAEHEAEEKRKLAETAERKHREEIAAMAAIKKELADTLEEQQVEFIKNKAELSPAGLASCRMIVPILLRNPSMPICIDSHTNCFLEKCKDHCIHMPLSQQRVDCVKAELKKGGAHNNIITKGWGCKHPEIKNQRAVHIYPTPKGHPGLRKGVSKMASL